ncbi:MAG: acyltransferase family protein [Planctomycetales bacterium]|nr:acyltransferase family protein [Planctomycetales bacterium]
MPQANPSLPSVQRMVSLDQFRGYTVVGMLLVNYVGGFQACPQVLKHSHDYLSYADTIMPQFLFAVGFAMRLSLVRRRARGGSSGVYLRMARRLLGLMLVSLVVYNVSPRAANWQELVDLGFWGAVVEPLKRHWFQTLMHIAVTSLWILPVIEAAVSVRLLWAVLSAGSHVWLSWWFNFEWVNTSPNGIDGGPLGFLTWCVPALLGTLAYDALANNSLVQVLPNQVWRIQIVLATGIMLLGYGLSCGTRFYDMPVAENPANTKLALYPVLPSNEQWQAKWDKSTSISDFLAEPPFVKPPDENHRKWNYWMISQRAGTLSYLVFSAGFSLFVFLLFILACDQWKWRLSFFDTFGTNALLAYVVHSMVASAVKPFVPSDSPGWYVTMSVLVFFAINWLIIRFFEKQNIYLRV